MTLRHCDPSLKRLRLVFAEVVDSSAEAVSGYHCLGSLTRGPIEREDRGARVTFRLQVVCMFFPGGVLLVIGGVLLDHLHGLGLSLALVGFLLLLAWPIFTITVHIRHGRKLRSHKKQGDMEPVSITPVRSSFEELSIHDPLHTFVTAVESRILTIGLPVAVLGGVGVFCLVTASDDPSRTFFKVFVGVAFLGLLGAYMFLLIYGRSTLTLRIFGVSLAVFGLAGISALAFVLARLGVTSVGDVVMAIASVAMVAAGLWLAVTGRNTVKRVD